MRLLILLSCLLPLGVTGQEMKKYLEGAVPVKNGLVVFTREVQAPGLQRKALFARIARMVPGRFKTSGNERGQVLYSNVDEGVIICQGREYLVFVNKSLVLDRALVDYQVTYSCRDGACVMEVSRVRYLYGESTPERYLAEEWITDERAYNKKRDKLVRGSDKFRVKTIDLVDELEGLLREAVRVNVPADAIPREASGATREEYQQVLPTEIGGNFINMLVNGKLTIKRERDEAIPARWGGIGYALDRPVVYCFVSSSAVGDRLVLSWTPAGQPSLYREVILECNVILSRAFTGEALPGIVVGEILSAWVK